MVEANRIVTIVSFGLLLGTYAVSAQAQRADLPTVTAADREARNEGARRKLLTGYVHEYVRRENVGEGFGYGAAVFGVLLGLWGAAVLEHDPREGATWIATSAVGTTTAVTSLFFSRDVRVDLLQVNMFVLYGGAGLGIGVAEDPGDVPRLTGLAMAGAGFAYGGLKAVNLIARPTPLHVLRRHRDRLDAGIARNEELPGIERDFRANDDPISHGVLAVPFGLGAAVAILPAFDDDSSKTETTWSLVFSGGLALTCFFSALTVDLVPAYENDLGIAGLEIVAGPTSIGSVLYF